MNPLIFIAFGVLWLLALLFALALCYAARRGDEALERTRDRDEAAT